MEEFSESGWSVIALTRSPSDLTEGRDVSTVQQDARSAPCLELMRVCATAQ
ncbi:hypothetical protein [Paenarthrobacter aromaticivorans]|uniref:hypothetical protein n=1 Tax=Paenarthrobacter aromaticivorans TaxID=2849150 RepID=UPI003A800DB3